MQATALAAEPHDAVVASTTGDARNWVSSACLSNVERRRADVELELRLSLHALAEMADERVVAHALAPHLDRSPAARHPRNPYRSANLSSNLRSVTLSEYEAGALVRRSSSGQVTSRRSRTLQRGGMHPRFILPLHCTCQDLFFRLVPPAERIWGAYFSRRA